MCCSNNIISGVFKWLSNISLPVYECTRISYQFICGWTFICFCWLASCEHPVLLNMAGACVFFQIIVLSKWRPKEWKCQIVWYLSSFESTSVLFCTRLLLIYLSPVSLEGSLFSRPCSALTVCRLLMVGILTSWRWPFPLFFWLHSFVIEWYLEFLHGLCFFQWFE